MSPARHASRPPRGRSRRTGRLLRQGLPVACVLVLLLVLAAAVFLPARKSSESPAIAEASAPVSASASQTAPARDAHGLPMSTEYLDFTADGHTSQYHFFADGVDWNKPVGVVFYFDGDSENQDSVFYQPEGDVIQGMARDANRRNMVFVPVMSPSTDGDGQITWWEDAQTNGTWFRALARHLLGTLPLDSSRIWLTGYSGGAEFITYELLARDSDWIKGGGATIVGGGDTDGILTAPSTAVKNMRLTWHEGTEDTPDSDSNGTDDDWSGTTAGQSGIAAYRKAGFTHTTWSTVEGADHGDYDLPSLLEQDLTAAYGAASSGVVTGQASKTGQ